MQNTRSIPPEAELSASERQQYETLVTGFREAQTGQNAIWRCEKLSDLLQKIQGGEDHELLWHDAYTMERLLHPVATMKVSAKVVMLAMQVLIADTRKTLDPTEELKAMEADIRAAASRMGSKARAMIGVLERLSRLEGLSIGIEFGSKIIDEIESCHTVEAALHESGDDPDVQVLGKAFELARQIEDAEDC